MADDFKPNIYPIMYWALLYGLSAGVVLFLLSVLSRFITLVWFPVFLAGLVWGGYRNYQRQRRSWEQTHNVTHGPLSPLAEFKEATRDIVASSRDFISEQTSSDDSSETPDTLQQPEQPDQQSPLSDTDPQARPPQ